LEIVMMRLRTGLLAIALFGFSRTALAAEDTPEKVAADWVAACKKLSDIYDAVKDEASAKEAAAKFEGFVEPLKAIAARMGKFKNLPKDFVEKYRADMRALDKHDVASQKALEKKDAKAYAIMEAAIAKFGVVVVPEEWMLAVYPREE
jgi:hypothetical protein